MAKISHFSIDMSREDQSRRNQRPDGSFRSPNYDNYNASTQSRSNASGNSWEQQRQAETVVNEAKPYGRHHQSTPAESKRESRPTRPYQSLKPIGRQAKSRERTEILFDDMLNDLEKVSKTSPPIKFTGKRPGMIDFEELEKSLDNFQGLSPANGLLTPIESKNQSSESWRQPSVLINPSNLSKKYNSNNNDIESMFSRNQSIGQSIISINDDISEKERLETENQRKQLSKKNADKRAADKLEDEMVAKTRAIRLLDDKKHVLDPRQHSLEIPLLSDLVLNENILETDYLLALMTAIRNDSVKSPVPEDFLSPDSYSHWQSTMKRSFQEVLVKLIKYRFVQKPEPVLIVKEQVEIRFSVIEAKGLLTKDNRARVAYCNITSGDLSQKLKKLDVFRTEEIESNNPEWNQSMTIEVKSLSDSIMLQVYDKAKDLFLGEIVFSMGDVLTKCAKGRFESWYDLKQKTGKKDKYVGGMIKIGAFLKEGKERPKPKTYQQIQQTLISMHVNNKSLYDILMRSCVVLDLYNPQGPDLLSEQSVCILQQWKNTWFITSAYQVISYMKILFEKYKQDLVSISELLKAFHRMYWTVKHKGGFNDDGLDECVLLLEEMKIYCSNAVLKYKELFPKNYPKGALESTILVLRMVHRFPTYKQRHPELPESHRDVLRIMMTESSIIRFQRFKELTTPLDENDVESVIDGINSLADMVNDEIDVDVEFFRPAFSQELDIVRLTAESQLKYFVLSLEDISDLLGTDDAVKNAAGHVFRLYKIIRGMGDRYAEAVPGLTSLSIGYIEGWFTPFMYKWLDHLSETTAGWVEKAIKADTWAPISKRLDGEVPLHSSSIMDVFSAINAKLEFITDLQWSDPVQNAQFFQIFAKVLFN
jgi:hypothetical protein